MIVEPRSQGVCPTGSPSIFLLDAFQVEADGRPRPVPLASQRVVARLALGGRADRSIIAGQLWPEFGEDRARNCLRSALWRIDKNCRGLVETMGTVLSLGSNVAVDVHELMNWAHTVLDGAAPDGPGGMPRVAVCGELLPGWCDEWVLLERSYLQQLHVRALETAAARYLSAGLLGLAHEAALAAVHTDSLRESAWRALVQVHLAEGNAIQALREFREFRELLLDELGIEPSAEMRRLVGHLLGPTGSGGGRRRG
jgi:DNA-binding SARP family transcriptional activator